MANPAMLDALLEEERASRRAPLALRPPAAGNPVMGQMGGGFQITPEELAFEPKGSRGQAFGTAAISALLGGARQAIPAYQASMGRQESRQVQEAYRGASQRFLEKENRTRQDFNELAQFRAQLTGEQPRLYAPPNMQITRETRTFTGEKGEARSQQQRVVTNPETGEVVSITDIGESTRQRPGKQITPAQASQYSNKQDYRAIIASGNWQDQVRDIIKAIDPERKIDINDENAASAAFFGEKATDKIPNFTLDWLNKLWTALDSVPGDVFHGTEKWRKGAKREFVKEIIGLWNEHKYGEPEKDVDTGVDFDARLKSLGAVPAAVPAAVPTQAPPLLEQARQAFSGAGDPYAMQPRSTYTPSVPGYRHEQFAGGGVSGIMPPMTTRSSPPPETMPAYAGMTKKFKRGDKPPRELSALERTLSAIVNGESAVR